METWDMVSDAHINTYWMVQEATKQYISVAIAWRAALRKQLFPCWFMFTSHVLHSSGFQSNWFFLFSYFFYYRKSQTFAHFWDMLWCWGKFNQTAVGFFMLREAFIRFCKYNLHMLFWYLAHESSRPRTVHQWACLVETNPLKKSFKASLLLVLI